MEDNKSLPARLCAGEAGGCWDLLSDGNLSLSGAGGGFGHKLPKQPGGRSKLLPNGGRTASAAPKPTRAAGVAAFMPSPKLLEQRYDLSRAEAREECGVFGIFAPGEDVSRLTYFGLFALQHRGQESAGIAVSDGRKLTTFRQMGLVSQAIDEETLESLRGDLAIGHTRYSTTGSSTLANAQPMEGEWRGGRWRWRTTAT